MQMPRAKGLTEEEDNDLRRLSYLAGTAGMSEWSNSRLAELRSRDRRGQVRLPREISAAEKDTGAKGSGRSKSSRWRRLGLRFGRRPAA